MPPAMQYSFLMSRGREQHNVRATAFSETAAREAIVRYYSPSFVVAEKAHLVKPAHWFLGEIDCT